MFYGCPKRLWNLRPWYFGSEVGGTVNLKLWAQMAQFPEIGPSKKNIYKHNLTHNLLTLQSIEIIVIVTVNSRIVTLRRI